MLKILDVNTKSVTEAKKNFQKSSKTSIKPESQLLFLIIISLKLLYSAIPPTKNL